MMGDKLGRPSVSALNVVEPANHDVDSSQGCNEDYVPLERLNGFGEEPGAESAPSVGLILPKNE